MQDRYAGDVGDFLTLGLLRILIDRSDLRLGIVWYRVPDETHNDDGKHVSYLDADNAIGGRLRALDPDLHERLGDIVRSGCRSVAAIERSAALPSGTVTFDDYVDIGVDVGADIGVDLAVDPLRDTSTARLASRRAWVDRAVAATAGCDVVFADPDNGIRPRDHPTPRHRAKADKYAYLDELAPFADRRQSVIIYQHADRSAAVEVQAGRRLDEASEALGVEALAAVRASRGSCRLFLVLPAPHHREHLAARLDAIEGSPWARELVVYRPRLG